MGQAISGEEWRLAVLRRLVAERRQRLAIYAPPILGEPGWDILLDLAIARETGVRISVSSLCIAAGVPTTTALRWIGDLTKRGLVVRSPDPADRRRSFIALSDEAAAGMHAYLDRIGRPAGVAGKQTARTPERLGRTTVEE